MIETHTLTTDGIRDSHRLPFWRDFVCDTFVELDCKSASREAFRGRITTCKADELRYSRVSSTRQHVIRDKRRISASDADCFLLSLQLSGRGMLRQGGREALINAGEFALYDVTRPYDLMFEDPFDQLVVRLPRAAVKDRLVNAEDLTAIAVSADCAQAQVARALLVQLADHLPALDLFMARKLHANALDLIAGAVSRQQGAAGDSPLGHSQRLLMQRILSFIDGNLHEPDLRSEQIASAHGISERYLRKLFESRDCGVSEWILRRRLENARSDLAAPTKAHLAVATIAYEWGFKDASHFSRAFKAQFGRSPRAFRQRPTG